MLLQEFREKNFKSDSTFLNPSFVSLNINLKFRGNIVQIVPIKKNMTYSSIVSTCTDCEKSVHSKFFHDKYNAPGQEQ